jgi:hypothetical protein
MPGTLWSLGRESINNTWKINQYFCSNMKKTTRPKNCLLGDILLIPDWVSFNSCILLC